MHLDSTALEREMLEVLGQNIQVTCQRLRVQIKIDKNEPSPKFAVDGLQVMRLVADMGKIPATWNISDRAVQLLGPAVEWAGKSSAIATALPSQDTSTPVCTGVQEGLYGVGFGTNHDDRVGTDIIGIGIPHVGQVFFAAGPLPTAGP